MTWRWGLVGTGNMAARMADALATVPGVQAHAVASRDLGRARRFAAAHGMPATYAAMEDLLADTQVDIVYVATPNHAHAAQVLAALEAGKHVLCEKPLTTSAAETARLTALARARGLLLVEAVWTAFLPTVRRAVALVKAGEVGEVIHATAELLVARDPAAFPHLYNPALAGGATFDLGVYPLTLLQLLVGPIVTLHAASVTGPTDVDETSVACAIHASGATSSIAVGLRAEGTDGLRLTGTRGALQLDHPLYRSGGLTLSRPGHDAARWALPAEEDGYAYEVREVVDCLNTRLVESPALPHAVSVATASLLARMRTNSNA